MSSPKNNKQLLKTLLTSNIAGCGCGKPKLSDVYEPTRKSKTLMTHKTPIDPQTHSSSSSCGKNGMSNFTADDDDDDDDGDHQCTTTSTTTISFNYSSSLYPSEPETTNPKNTENSSPSRAKISDSIAVVKESDDPYGDFRNSMLQMIVEKRIYSKEDLEELLSCFLELNSASHHGVIIQAFTQIWSDLIGERKGPIM